MFIIVSISNTFVLNGTINAYLKKGCHLLNVIIVKIRYIINFFLLNINLNMYISINYEKYIQTLNVQNIKSY